MLILDTHIVLHLLDDRLTAQEEQLLAADDDWAVASIVLYEIAQSPGSVGSREASQMRSWPPACSRSH